MAGRSLQRATDWLGPTLDVQGIFEDRLMIFPQPAVNFFELGTADDDEFIVVNGQTIEEDTWGVVWGSEGTPDLLMTQNEAQDYIDAFDTTPYWQEPTDPRAYGPFFVVDGMFTGSTLVASGQFSLVATPDSIISDWPALG